MGFELSGVIKGILYNKDGTVDYVFDDVKLDEVIVPFENETDTERDQDEKLFLSSKEISFTTTIDEDVLYQLGVIHWYNWWIGDRIEYNLEALKYDS